MASLIPDPAPHVHVQGSGLARLSSNRKCFLLAISDLRFREMRAASKPTPNHYMVNLCKLPMNRWMVQC